MSMNDSAHKRKGTKPKPFIGYDTRAFEFIPLHRPKAKKTYPNGKTKEVGKAPLHAQWTTKRYDSKAVKARCLEEERNGGIRLKATQLVVDIDPRNGGDEGWLQLCADLGIDDSKYPKVITGSGGVHLYMSKPEDLLIRDTLDSEEYNGVEFKTKGRQVVAAGSIHPNGTPYRWDDSHPPISAELPPAPRRLLKAIERPARSGVTGGGQYTPDKIAEALSNLDAEDFSDHGKWLQIMQACHHASAGEARSEFVEWSTQDPAYAKDAYIIGKRWDSLHAEKNDGVTFRTLNKFLRDAGASAHTVAGSVTEDDFEDDPDFDYGGEDDLDFDTPAKLSEAYSMFDVPDDGVAPEPSKFAVLDEWQFITDSMQFVHNDGLQTWNKDQFAMQYGYLSRKGDVITDIKRGKIPLRKYDRQVYIPNADPVVTYEGAPAFNTWRPSAMIPKKGDHQWFLDHVAFMFPDRTSRGYVLDYMAQLIQHPEVKIHFALLIQSAQGVGKGALAMVLRKIIGKRNCVEPSNDEVTKHWTGWQESAQLAIINELMAGGSAVVLNRLKAPITEDSLRIEKKFGNTFSIPNHMNIFGMTNFKDALPITNDDRRWLILFSNVEARPADYYESLFTNIADDDKVAAVMHYLMNRFIALNPKGKAPSTAAKREMEQRAKSDELIKLGDMFEERRAPFHFDLVRVADIVARIEETPGGRRGANSIALRFLDQIKAQKLKRYTHGRNGMKAYQLYAVRDHARWKTTSPLSAIEAFREACPDLDE
ncbi:bifunctional DNA primase/polymerase [Bradyrhizobium sp. BRP19]|uniref:bifunctional DNA primase/polymerase n=1 Tax=Bradyrhizobium sp. BRP19 TaxID=2793823 RepID=UPI001CD4205E|nr:bifunctional DNA primase/polymerase [Bradyrhizobium sp. BRP19]MCA1549348.1 bifunctional DNA primase/polymerase [Bradyrhizobium sp. BRP19]